jgi:hypothetical protein
MTCQIFFELSVQLRIWELCAFIYDARPTMARIHSQTSACIIYGGQSDTE